MVHVLWGFLYLDANTYKYSGNETNVLRITVITLWHRFIVSYLLWIRKHSLKIRYKYSSVSVAYYFVWMAFIKWQTENHKIYYARTIMKHKKYHYLHLCLPLNTRFFWMFEKNINLPPSRSISFTKNKQYNVLCNGWISTAQKRRSWAIFSSTFTQ